MIDLIENLAVWIGFGGWYVRVMVTLVRTRSFGQALTDGDWFVYDNKPVFVLISILLLARNFREGDTGGTIIWSILLVVYVIFPKPRKPKSKRKRRIRAAAASLTKIARARLTHIGVWKPAYEC